MAHYQRSWGRGREIGMAHTSNEDVKKNTCGWGKAGVMAPLPYTIFLLPLSQGVLLPCVRLYVHPSIILDCGQQYITQPHFKCHFIDTDVLI